MTAIRVPPLAPEELDETQAEFLKGYTNHQGEYPNIFGTLARHMKLVDAWSTFGLYTMQHCQVDPVLREGAILRTAIHVGSEYEWHHHCTIGRRLGMTDAVFEEIRQGTVSDNPQLNLMVRCADDLHSAHKLSDTVWDAMQREFGLPYTLDVIFIIGAYTTMGMALNSCGVAIET